MVAKLNIVVIYWWILTLDNVGTLVNYLTFFINIGPWPYLQTQNYNRVESWPHWQGKNTLAYFAVASVTKKKCFKALPPEQ